MPALNTEQKAMLKQLISQYRLEPLADELAEKAQSAVYMVTTNSDDYTEQGNSRIGGIPDLPVGEIWPQTERGFLTFVAQINLSELPALTGNPLPDMGLLSFFIGGTNDRPHFYHRVLFFDGESQPLQKAIQPDLESFQEATEWATYKPYRVKMQTGISLPNYNAKEWQTFSQLMHEVDANGWHWEDRYFEMESALSVFGQKRRDTSQLLGFAESFGDYPSGYYAQLDREEKWKLGMPIPTTTQPIQEEVAKWHLVLQLDSHFDAGMCWWDAGMLQYVIHDDDLKVREFRRTFCTLITS